jgi:hypothetical protein
MAGAQTAQNSQAMPRARLSRWMLSRGPVEASKPIPSGSFRHQPCHRRRNAFQPLATKKSDEDPEEADPNANREPRVGVRMKMDWSFTRAQGLWAVMERVLQWLRSVGFYDSPDPGGRAKSISYWI